MGMANSRKGAVHMLNENIKTFRKSKGLSQEELAIKLNVVRQTVSKWEQGQSVPDADMLISLSEALDTSVASLLGGDVADAASDDVGILSEKLEVVNLQLARAKGSRRKALHWSFVALSAIIVITFVALYFWGSPYLDWDYSDPETAVAGTFLHGFEFVFVRLAPFVLLGSIVGDILTRKKP
jgi:putative transcriptional regulator